MEELIARIKMAMGFTGGEVTDELITAYLTEWLLVYPDNECLALHNTVISLYEWLIKNSASGASGGGKRREKVGKREIELNQYDKAGDWEKALDTYLDSPWSTFPSCRDVLGNGSVVIVGGVDRSKVDAINCDSTIVTGGASEVTGVQQPSTLRDSPFGWTIKNRRR